MSGFTTTLWGWLQGTSVPVLPSLMLARIYLCLSWSAVLLAITGPVLARSGLGPGTRRLVAALLVVATCLPPPWGLASWLGLAFQAPSVLTTLACLWLAGHRLAPTRVPPLPLAALQPWLGVAVAWALVLLLDVLAWWPVSLYAWGFSPLAVGLLALVACLPALLGRSPVLSALLLASLGIHVLLRWPTGNAWDVWVDPGLALWLAAGAALRWARPRLRGWISGRRALQQPLAPE
jgi:hypothetical protein